MSKKRFACLLLCFVLLSAALTGCVNPGDESSVSQTQSTEESKEVSEVKTPDENAKKLWKDDFADEGSGFANADKVYGLEVFHNGETTADLPTAVGAEDDYRYIFKSDNASRVAVLAEGYALTVPSADFTSDYTLGALRSKYTADDFVLTVTTETSNPYGNNANGWNTYLTEWLNVRIDDLGFITANSLRRTRAAATDTEILEGYEVMFYNMEIRNPKEIALPYYDIAIIRKEGEYVRFHLIVMKSAEKNLDRFDDIVHSFREFDSQGTAKSIVRALEVKIPDYWSAETRAYYDLLMSSDEVRWGFFTASMPDDDSTSYESVAKRLESEQTRLQTAFDYQFDILPTYTHIGWGSELTGFPSRMAETYAGGNGFNGKPVLQFTYQFTTLNNTDLSGYTPMFDIMRGVYDDHFREIARAIKAYGKPVLFRLNNEMNSDWVSYAGIVTLLDPDVFIATWERLYSIFREEGVDNCIWIWNPIAVSCPYSSWGESLNYLPSLDTVQALGLTYYEMNNGTSVRSFASMYTELYNKNTPWFDNYPWIISEFACGAGGEKLFSWDTDSYVTTVLDRNASLQANWVREMFKAFNDTQNEKYFYAKNIKAAVWFSTNDSVSIGSKNYITNKLKITDNLEATIQAFKDGLAKD